MNETKRPALQITACHKVLTKRSKGFHQLKTVSVFAESEGPSPLSQVSMQPILRQTNPANITTHFQIPISYNNSTYVSILKVSSYHEILRPNLCKLFLFLLYSNYMSRFIGYNYIGGINRTDYEASLRVIFLNTFLPGLSSVP
jgi:hypothetical protein